MSFSKHGGQETRKWLAEFFDLDGDDRHLASQVDVLDLLDGIAQLDGPQEWDMMAFRTELARSPELTPDEKKAIVEDFSGLSKDEFQALLAKLERDRLSYGKTMGVTADLVLDAISQGFCTEGYDAGGLRSAVELLNNKDLFSIADLLDTHTASSKEKAVTFSAGTTSANTASGSCPYKNKPGTSSLVICNPKGPWLT